MGKLDSNPKRFQRILKFWNYYSGSGKTLITDVIENAGWDARQDFGYGFAVLVPHEMRMMVDHRKTGGF